mmetsp:Transcript_4566/g.9892  ORF Transcript_4566/g.9892 Transcript_4566/m.9892 type:complete len:239 (-) Transcript_4566:837-1553(-)
MLSGSCLSAQSGGHQGERSHLRRTRRRLAFSTYAHDTAIRKLLVLATHELKYIVFLVEFKTVEFVDALSHLMIKIHLQLSPWSPLVRRVRLCLINCVGAELFESHATAHRHELLDDDLLPLDRLGGSLRLRLLSRRRLARSFVSPCCTLPLTVVSFVCSIGSSGQLLRCGSASSLACSAFLTSLHLLTLCVLSGVMSVALALLLPLLLPLLVSLVLFLLTTIIIRTTRLRRTGVANVN